MATKPISNATRVPIKGFWYPGMSPAARFEGYDKTGAQTPYRL